MRYRTKKPNLGAGTWVRVDFNFPKKADEELPYGRIIKKSKTIWPDNGYYTVDMLKYNRLTKKEFEGVYLHPFEPTREEIAAWMMHKWK